MSKIIINSQGKVLTSGGDALEVTSSIDSNIIASNIKKDVTILGVTGTYESGGSSVTTFYTASLTNPNTKGSVKKPEEPGGPEPGTHITFYVSYPAPANNNKVPDLFIIYDETNYFSPTCNYYVLQSSINDYNWGGTIGEGITIISKTSTVATLEFSVAYEQASFDPTQLKFAPVYLN